MKTASYQSLHGFILSRPGVKKAVVLCTKALPGVIYVTYPLLLLWLVIGKHPQLLPAVLTPLAGFLLVTALRAGINAPRPYEVMDIPPLYQKTTVGKSFPSRHAACAAVIAVTALGISVPLGIVLSMVGLLTAGSRVLSGIHFLKDVAAGLALGTFVGIVGMYLIP